MWFGFKKQDTQTAQPVNQFPQHRHKAAHPQGGFNLSYGEENSETQKVAASVFKQLGSKILTGNFGSLLQISKPIAMSLDMSFLHGVALYYYTLTRGNIYTNLLERCCDLTPIEQIKYICAFLISGLHCNGEITKMKSPLDPLVGETVQLIKEDGTQFYAEQTQFDPPVCYYYVQGNNYKIYGSDKLEVNVHKTVNSLTGVQSGKQTIVFKNGAIYKCLQKPTMELSGLVMGDRILNWQGKMIIEGPGVRGIINFNYNPEGMMSKLTSFFKSAEQAKNYDIIEVDIFEIKTDDEGKIVETLITQGIGSWLEGIQFGEQTYWQIDEQKDKWISPENILESDTTCRADLLLMRQQKLDDAQLAKLELESQNLKDIENRRQK